MAVYVPSIRAFRCAKGLHRGSGTGRYSSQTTRLSPLDVPGRLVAGGKTSLQQLAIQTSNLLKQLGLMVNRKKSVLVPSTPIVFLGMSINTATMQACWPQEKATKVQHKSRRILRHGVISETELRCLLGKMESRFAARSAPLHYRGLQCLLQEGQNYFTTT